MDDARAITGHVRLMGDDDDGQPIFLIELLKHAQDFLARVRIEVAGRLVGEQKLRLIDQGAGDGDALLLAAGELRGVMIQSAGQAEERSSNLRARSRPSRPLRCEFVYASGIATLSSALLSREQVEVLKNEAELAIADVGPLSSDKT